MWAVVDEVSVRRPWKDYQRAYTDSLAKRVEQELSLEIADLDSIELQEIQGELAAAKDSMAGTFYQTVYHQHDEILEEIVENQREFQFAKSRSDEAYYFYKRSLHEGHEDLGQKKKLEENEAQMAEFQAVVKRLEGVRDSVAGILDVYKKAEKDARTRLADLFRPIDKNQAKLSRVRSAPIEIRQVMMLDYDRNPFNDPKARVDRCQSCHSGWSEELMEEAPQPFKNHSNPELLKAHNPEVFGCTPCHRGQGAALTTEFAHGPGDHYWENPILEGKDVWAACNECHENESVLKYAPEFTKAKRLVLESGCYGCHEIKGYTDVAKIGPELAHLGKKTTPDWVFRWIKNPRDYNAHTRMPNFKLTDDEAGAATAFLMNVSTKGEFSTLGSYSAGSALQGKRLVESVGCLACHSIGENTAVREKRGTSYDIAPELSHIGSKVSADWALDWVRDPRHYNPSTRMPDLRLTDSEARDIVAYLMTLRDERSFSVLSVDLKSAAMIKRGEKVVREYGCTGCHLIPGLEKESRVSVSLSNFGRKRVEEMDFGDTHVEHTWAGWITNKLKNSRAFETDRIVQKMPVFAFSDDEIASIRMFLLSQTKDEPDKKYVRKFDLKMKDIEEGRRIAIKYNCQQCHQLEGSGAHISVLLTDAAYLPPIITGEGKKVQEPWLHSFLQSPARVGQPNSIRPWIPTRMPTFHLTNEEINQLTKYFLGLSDQELELRDYQTFAVSSENLTVGKQIFTDFQCAKCHPSGVIVPGSAVSTTDLAPFLGKARDRLKPEWIVEWLADPAKLQPGTRMPTFFPDGESPLPDVLGGDARKQMQAIRDYLLSIGVPARPVVVSTR